MVHMVHKLFNRNIFTKLLSNHALQGGEEIEDWDDNIDIHETPMGTPPNGKMFSLADEDSISDQ